MKIKELFKGKIVTFSNFLSALRVILLPFIGYTLYMEKTSSLLSFRYYALIILVVMISTDFLDGYIARKFNQVSKLGQFLDPIADKIATNSLGILLIFYREYPIWVVILCFIRDLHGFVGSALLYKYRNVQASPNMPGKFVIFTLAIAAFIYILNPVYSILGISLHAWSIGIIFFFIIYSTTLYWKTYFKVYFGQIS